ncbi:fibrillin-1 isoform X2 [Hydra vulgaris]|uniref:fibrillin-1 isoform X2 n=1 Tax=Hydra vulgaris TaxID=6087 RepID=UPI0032EA1F0C
MNTNGSFLCSCNMGWTLGEDNASCVDVNECASSSPPCSLFNGVCNNTYGSYFCSCNKGWMLAQDNATCVDVNECIENVTSCSNGGCITVDEKLRCPVYLVASNSIPLTKGAVIANIPILEKEYIVSFDVYLASFTTDVRIVVYFTIGLNRSNNDMIPALLLYPNGNMAIPAPANGNFFTYPNPIALNTWTNVRISQVLIGTQYVNSIRINENTVSDYTNEQAQDFYNVTVYASDTWFEAQDGFIRNLFFINGKANNYECDVHPPCSWNNGVCTNSNGSYYCSCTTGWTLGQDGISCIDINECIQSNPPCSWSNGVCMNTNGSFLCSCNMGWTLGEDNASCVDVNECASSSPPCSLFNGVCNNTYGSYFCSCNKGWMLAQDNATCVDVNECIENVTSCSNGGCITVDEKLRCPVYLVASNSIPLTKGAVIANIPILEKEYIVSFDVYLASFTTDVRIVVYFTIGLNRSNNDMIPALLLYPNGNMAIPAPANGNFFTYPNPIALNTWTNVRISQVLIGTQYVNSIRINENTVSDYTNEQAQDFYNVTVYASDTWFEAQDGFIRNLFFINGKANNYECDVHPPCSWNNGVCTNSNGSYYCSCTTGWTLGQDGISCIDINECIQSNPPCSWSNGVCMNTNGSFLCSCNMGWTLGEDNASCVDVNECASSSPPCSLFNGVCNNTYGSYFCSCNKGWMLAQDNATCVGINECIQTNSECSWSNGVCTNTNGSFFCSCSVGWALGQDNASCVDVDECSSNIHPCSWSNGVCLNTLGSFICSCKYRWILGKDNSSCIDICEGCEENKNKVCDVKSATKMLCLCKNGYFSLDNMMTCIDVDDCSSGINGCRDNSICVNTDGGYNCTCPIGFILTNDGMGCEDVNECLQNKCGLDDSVTCINKVGNFKCICPQGQFFNSSVLLCQDINECLFTGAEYPCDSVRGHCKNRPFPVKYVCSCPTGWSLSSKNTCTDVNECLNWCNGTNSRCINQAGGFQCMCAVGYAYSNVTHQCEQVNMCTLGFQCPNNSVCTMTIPGSVSCQCLNGLIMDYSSNCVEINKCNDPNICSDKPHSRCVNKQGIEMWSCECLNGYQAVGNFCTLDECKIAEQANKSLCKLNQQCIDTTSSFECICLTGFSLISTGDCEDINECILNKTACQSNADCVNTYGSYYCKCKIGFVADNIINSSLMHCNANESIWSSWEQMGTCSELCSTDDKQGKIKFQRRCLAIDFNNCNGQFLKEEHCNSEYCHNKIRIAKSLQCERWSNMQPSISDISAQQNETWLKKLKSWNKWKVQGCQQSLNDASLLLNQDIKSIRNEIKRLNGYKSMLVDGIDCNTYIQRQAGFLKEYISVYSKMTMYVSIKAALSNLKSRIDLKLNNCARRSSLFGVYSSLSQV